MIYLVMVNTVQKILERNQRSVHHVHVDRKEGSAVATSDCDHHGQAATWHTHLRFRQIRKQKTRRKIW